MRKSLSVLAFYVFLSIFSLTNGVQVANAGPQCSAAGGVCKTSCPPSEAFVGALDCTSPQGRCCVPGPSGSATGTKSPEIVGCSGGQGFQTAIGCIPVDSPQNFATWALRWGMGIAGGVALGLIGYAGITIITSSGNPQKLQAGKELLTSAIAGLALLLFGVFLLRFIGVEILKIPGFG